MKIGEKMKKEIKNFTIPCYKTIEDTARIVGLAKYHVRQLVLNNKIKYIKTGKKYLVNVDNLITYLNIGEAKIASCKKHSPVYFEKTHKNFHRQQIKCEENAPKEIYADLDVNKLFEMEDELLTEMINNANMNDDNNQQKDGTNPKKSYDNTKDVRDNDILGRSDETFSSTLEENSLNQKENFESTVDESVSELETQDENFDFEDEF